MGHCAQPNVDYLVAPVPVCKRELLMKSMCSEPTPLRFMKKGQTTAGEPESIKMLYLLCRG